MGTQYNGWRGERTIMSKEDIYNLLHMNQRLNLILGYAMGFVTHTSIQCKEDEAKYRWLITAIENVIYLDKPLPPMP